MIDGLDATIHWASPPKSLTQNYPTVRLHPNRFLVVTGVGQSIVMAGGGTSNLDLVLYLIGRFVGLREALDVAKAYLIEWHEAGQQPYASLLQAAEDMTTRWSRATANAAAGAAVRRQARPRVEAMTKLSGLPERAIPRASPRQPELDELEYVHAVRLEEAKQMLETEDTLVEEAIALEVGYEDASFFNRLFRRMVGLTPAQGSRRRFGSSGGACSAIRWTHRADPTKQPPPSGGERDVGNGGCPAGRYAGLAARRRPYARSWTPGARHARACRCGRTRSSAASSNMRASMAWRRCASPWPAVRFWRAGS